MNAQAAAAAGLADLKWFIGEATDTAARVYLELPLAQAGEDWQLAGRLSGPFCQRAATLSATYKFVDRQGGALDRQEATTLLAEARVSDPCFWLPGEPYLYKAEVELRQAGRVVATTELTLGMRPLGTGGRNLRLAGKRWVLRAGPWDHQAAGDPSARANQLTQWRAASAAVLAANPDDALCRAASELGVLVVADLRSGVAGAADELNKNLARIARWPAAAIAILPAGAAADELRPLARNMLFAQAFSAAEEVRPYPWAQLVFAENGEKVEAARFARKVEGCPLPVVAFQNQGKPRSFAGASAAKAACDLLQRELAAGGDYAGYVIK